MVAHNSPSANLISFHNIGAVFIRYHHHTTPRAINWWKIITYTAWNGCFLDHDEFCHALLQYRNMPSNKDKYLQPKSFMGALPMPRILFLFTIVHFLKSDKVKQKLSSKARQHRSPPQLTTVHMLTPLQKLKLAPMLLSIQHPPVGHLWHCNRHIT